MEEEAVRASVASVDLGFPEQKRRLFPGGFSTSVSVQVPGSSEEEYANRFSQCSEVVIWKKANGQVNCPSSKYVKLKEV